jgi:hypothetical protein
MGMRTEWTAFNRMEFLMSIKTKIAALALATLAVTASMASTTTPAEAKGFGLGWGIGAGLIGPPWSAARSPPATTATITTAIAAAAGLPRSMPTATTSGAFVPATDDRLNGFLFDAFSRREPVPTPDQVRGRLSLENALIVDSASGTGASSTPCRTRPARLSPGRVNFFSG